MTGPELMTAIGFFVMLIGFLSGVWWRIDGKVRGAEDKANQVAADLASHRLHVAETYITKAGMRETTEQLMEAITGVRQAVDHMTLRIDRIAENQSKARSTRS